MFEKALLVNLTNSLERISFMINGDIQTTPTPFINIELCLNTIETINGNVKHQVEPLFDYSIDANEILISWLSDHHSKNYLIC
jgi:hypothetical protein